MSQVYLNGAFLPLEEAKVSVLDRGFLFGDGIYEVIPAFHGRLLAFDRHLERLNQSLDAIRMEPVQPEGGWKALCQQLLDNNRSLGEHRAVYLQITRGTGELRTHFFPDDIKPTVFVMVMAIGGPMSDRAQEAFSGKAGDGTGSAMEALSHQEHLATRPSDGSGQRLSARCHRLHPD